MPTTKWDNLQILVVEDSEDDLFFFKRLCKKAGLNCPLAIATDGQQAIEHLKATSFEDGGANLPQLMFLDLKLPLRGGFEVLEWMRTQPRLEKTVPVVLSSSAETRDVQRAFQLGAAGYLVKYPEPAVLLEVVRAVSELPPGADRSALVLPGLKQ